MELKLVLNYFIQSIPILIALLVWAVRIEIKISQIQTDLTWIKKVVS